MWSPNGLLEAVFSAIGLKQGFPQSTVLFSLYRDEMSHYIERFGSSGACLTGIVIQILPYDDDIMLISDTPEGLERHLNALKVFCFEFYTYFDLTFKGPQSLREAVVLDFLVDMQPLVLLKDSVHNCSSKNNELNCGYSIHLSHQI